MSTRRRIKAAAILPPKRPTRDSSAAASAPKQVKVEPKLEVKSEPKVEVKTESDVPTLPPVEKVPPIELKSPDKPVPVADKVPVDSYATSTELAANEVVAVVQESIDLTDNDVFKSPPVLANHRRTESFSASDAEYDRNEDLGAHKIGAQGPPSPVKFRQRIRPTPFFGMRRNSTQGYGSDMEDEPRRQRHTSTSSNTGGSTPQRIRPPTVQRIRTESSCSNFSDYSKDPSIKHSSKPPTFADNSRANTARREFLVRFNGGVPEKTSMKMSDLIYYNPSTNPMVATDPQKPTESAGEEIKNESTPEESPRIKPEAEEKETAMPVPQLKLGPDGEMILDEQSLVIETTADKEARATLANTKVIYMDEFSGNNGFYRRTKRTKDWSSEETIKFYRCLHTVGTDFSLMLALFPNRSRRDLKLKFKKEERINLNLINKALLYPKTFNVSELKQELDKEEHEKEAKRKEKEEIEKQKAEKKAILKQRPRTRIKYTSKSSNILKDGDLVYELEENTSEQKVASPVQTEIRVEKKKRTRKPKQAPTLPLSEKLTENIPAEDKKHPIEDFIVENQINNIHENSVEPGLQTIIGTVSDPLSLESVDQIDPNHPSSAIENYTYTCDPDIIPSETVEVSSVEIIDVEYNEQYVPVPSENSIVPDVSSIKAELPSTKETTLNAQNEPQPEDLPIKISKLEKDTEGGITVSDEYPDVFDYEKTQTEPKPLHVKSEEVEKIDENQKHNEPVENIKQDKNDATEDEVYEVEVIPNVKEDSNVGGAKRENEEVSATVEEVVENEEPSETISPEAQNNEITSSKDVDAAMERFMLNDLGKILTDLVNGSLVVVASEDEENPSRVINEIYIMDKETGTLSDVPLDLPEDIVNCIVEELNITAA